LGKHDGIIYSKYKTRNMSFHEGSNWQAQKEDEKKPLYENEKKPAAGQSAGVENKIDEIIDIVIRFKQDYERGLSVDRGQVITQITKLIQPGSGEGEQLALELWGKYCTLFRSTEASLEAEFAGKYVMEKHDFLAAIEEALNGRGI
jgi:hypothetical protein